MQPRIFIVVGVVGVVVVGLARTSAAQGPSQLQGLVFGGFGSRTCPGCDGVSILHLGGGGEVDLWPRVAIAGEIGFIAPAQEPGEGRGIISANALFRFGSAPERFRPFLTGGCSFFVDAINVGGGIDWWLSPRIGMRYEVRDHIPIGLDAIAHYVDARVGLVFR
jgi:hypothetical protein